jgi:6-phosphogluconolactonase
MVTRRNFLIALPVFAVSAGAFAISPFRRRKLIPVAPAFVYLGTDTGKGKSKGIYQSRFDSVTGRLTPPVLAAAIPTPISLALSPPRNGRRFLYSANSTSPSSAAATTFAIDPTTAALRQIGQVAISGSDPACISIDDTGRVAFVASFDSSVSSFRVLPDGTLSQPVDSFDLRPTEKFGPGTNAQQDASHPHSVTVSPDNRFLLVADLGTDRISVFLFDPETGHLSEPHLFTNNRPGSGPRRIVFHPNGRWVYGINELDSTLDRYLWTATRFSETPQGLLVSTNDPIKTIAPDFPTDKNAAAELVISSDGSFLYASNRGEDSLVAFSISPKNGRLTLLQRISCGGKTPVHFTLSPNAQWLLCGNQDSSTITVFRRDSASGKLAGPTQTVPLESPLFTLFA